MQHKEQQQWILIQQWFKDNYFYIIALLVLAMGGSGGWAYWKQVQFEHRSMASDFYQEVIDLSSDGKLSEARTTLTKLEKDFIDTAYPYLGNLQLAKEAFLQNNVNMARESLQWVTTNSEDENLIYVAADRLVRLFIDQNQPEKVAAIVNDALDKITNNSSVASLNMSLGDAYLQQKNIALARSAYEIAKQNLPANSTLKELIDMKLRDASSL